MTLGFLPGLVCFSFAVPWLLHFSLGPTPSVLQSLACSIALILGGLVAAQRNLAGGQKFSPTRWIALGWLIAACLSCVIALIQYFNFAGGLQPWVSVSNGEAFANLRQRNHFAVLCLLGLTAWRWSFAKLPASSLWQTPLICSWLLLILGNAASQSRTGLIGLVLFVVLANVWRSPNRPAAHYLVWATLPVYAAASLLLPILAGHGAGGWGAFSRLSDADAQCQSRLTLWSNVLHLIQQKPWLGWGWGELDYAHYASLYPGERFCAILDNAHNLPLHLAVELGVPVAVLLCLTVVYAIWRQRPWAETDATRQMAWMILAVIGLHSLLEYPLWYGPFQMTVLLCIALLWPSTPRGSGAVPDLSQSNRLFSLYSIHLSATIFAAFLLYVGWDYHRISQMYLAPQDRSSAYAANTLAKIQGSWLFRPQVRFAELAITPLTKANAAHQLQLGLDLLHFSPEPRVIERVLDAALVLHRDDLLAFHMQRYRAAFAEPYAAWQQKAIPPQSSPISPHASPAASHP